MGHEPDKLETRIARCERVIFGDDDSSEGLSARMKVQENYTAEIRKYFEKLNWLIITAIIVGILNIVINRGSIPTPNAPQQSTSVITGDAAADPAKAELIGTHREYLTTSDVARIEQVSVREVQDMIVNGEIQPAPVKDGREYRIAASYRIQPQTAADCGEQPQ